MPNEPLKTRLKIAKDKLKSNDSEEKNGQKSSLGVAFKMSTELVSAVAVGTIIGFILDNWFGTKPWFIIILFFLGSIAGIYNVIKTANRIQEKN